MKLNYFASRTRKFSRFLHRSRAMPLSVDVWLMNTWNWGSEVSVMLSEAGTFLEHLTDVQDWMQKGRQRDTTVESGWYGEGDGAADEI